MCILIVLMNGSNECGKTNMFFSHTISKLTKKLG